MRGILDCIDWFSHDHDQAIFGGMAVVSAGYAIAKAGVLVDGIRKHDAEKIYDGAEGLALSVAATALYGKFARDPDLSTF
jgi:hypothetical protein